MSFNIFNSIYKKFLAILIVLILPFFFYSLFYAVYSINTINTQINSLSNDSAILRTGHLASYTSHESNAAMLKALSTKNKNDIQTYRKLFNRFNNEFNAYINALAWGTETKAFKNSSNGKNYVFWLKNNLHNSIVINSVSPQLQTVGSYADLYFSGFTNHANKIFEVLENTKVNDIQDNIQFEKDRAEYFNGKVENTLNQLVIITNKILEKSRIDLKNKLYGTITISILSNGILWLVIIFLGWFFIKNSLVGPIIRLTNKVSLLEQGLTDIEIPIETHDEIGVLANQFNVLLQNINKVSVSKNYVDRVLNSITNILITIGTDGKIKTANSMTHKLLKYTKKDIIGMGFEKLFTNSKDSVCETIKDILIKTNIKETEKLCAIEPFFTNIETNILSKNGTEIPVLFSTMPICNEKGEISHLLCVAQDISKQKEVEEKLEHLAEHDPLTDLPNRNFFNLSLDLSIKRAERTAQAMALLYLDLDNFKEVNDTLGHDVGDLLLIETAKRLRSNIRKDDIVARLGGDEFAIILNGLSDPKNAGNIAQIINDSLNAPYQLGDHTLNISTSIGIACFPTDGNDTVTLNKNADIALYSAKELGRNNYQYFTPELNKEHFEQMKIENDLRDGLANNEFFLVYQPRYDLNTKQIIGMEALLRWKHAKEGLIPPAKFIPIAESSGFIIPLGKWVLKTACDEFVNSFLKFNPKLILSINISPRQLFVPEFPTVVSTILDKIGMPAKNLEIELTETTIVKHKKLAIRTLNKLHEMKISIAIDNFGSAYASLDYLKEMPVKTIIIDKTFIHDIAVNSNSEAIVKSIITLAKNLGLKTVADGIETEEQLSFLCNNQCPEALGYFFSKPTDIEEMKKLLEKK